MTCERLTLGEISEGTEREHLARYDFAVQYVRNKQVADIACGTGYGTQMLAEAGAKSVLGMDISADAVRYSRQTYDGPNLSYAVADAQNLATVRDAEFDVIVSFETIEHLTDVEAYLDELKRTLRPGGTLLISTPDRRIASVLHPFLGHPKNPFHVREYTKSEFLGLLSTRFQIKACYGQAFVPGWRVFWPIQVLIKVLCRFFGEVKGREVRDRLYNNSGHVEVVHTNKNSGIANFWVAVCIRP
jgi:SAM-dependent methyltransferase